MKKVLSILLVLAMVFCFAACGNDAQDEPTTEPQEESGGAMVLTITDIDNAPFPTGYTKTSSEGEDEEFTYPEDFDHSLLMPELATVAERTVVSSAIEDDMIYTLCDAELQDGTKLQVLYINNPDTLEFVAGSLDYEDGRSYNYQFVY